MVNTSNSEPGGPGFKTRPSRCFLRQGTLLSFVSLHLGVQMGNGLASRPAGSSNTPYQLLHANETGISSGRLGFSGFWLVCAFTLPFPHSITVL